jgi:hypothetical protein
MRNSAVTPPVASSTSLSFEAFYNGLSDRQKDQFDRDEREQFIRQAGMREIDNQIDWPEEMMEVPDDVSDDEIFDVSSDDVSSDDGAGLLVRPMKHPRHILRKAR